MKKFVKLPSHLLLTAVAASPSQSTAEDVVVESGASNGPEVRVSTTGGHQNVLGVAAAPIGRPVVVHVDVGIVWIVETALLRTSEDGSGLGKHKNGRQKERKLDRSEGHCSFQCEPEVLTFI